MFIIYVIIHDTKLKTLDPTCTTGNALSEKHVHERVTYYMFVLAYLSSLKLMPCFYLFEDFQIGVSVSVLNISTNIEQN